MSTSVSLASRCNEFCEWQLCRSIVLGVIAYRYTNPVSVGFALTLLPRLDVAPSAKMMQLPSTEVLQV